MTGSDLTIALEAALMADGWGEADVSALRRSLPQPPRERGQSLSWLLSLTTRTRLVTVITPSGCTTRAAQV